MTPFLTKLEIGCTDASNILASGGIMLDVDATALIQAAMFLTLVILFKPLIVTPVMSLLARREKLMDGQRDEAREMQEKAAELLRKYEAKLVTVRVELDAERDSLRHETAKMESAILVEAEAAVKEITEAGRAEIEKQRSALRAQLAIETETLAQSLVKEASRKGAA